MLVPEGAPPRDGRPAYRDATPADLERAGWVRRERLRERDAEMGEACRVLGPVDPAEGYVPMARRVGRERDEAIARAEKAERERDEARRLHSEAEAQVACRTELRAQVASLHAELTASPRRRRGSAGHAGRSSAWPTSGRGTHATLTPYTANATSSRP